MHEPLCARAGSGIQRVACAEHIRAPERVRAGLHPDSRRGVDDHVGAARRLLPGARRRDVARYDVEFGIGPHVDTRDL